MITTLVSYACALTINYQGTLYSVTDVTSDFAQPKGFYTLENKQIAGMQYQARVSCGDMCGISIRKTKDGSGRVDVVARSSAQLNSKSFELQGSDDEATFSFECIRKQRSIQNAGLRIESEKYFPPFILGWGLVENLQFRFPC